MFVAESAMDETLDYLKFNTTELHFCSQEPTNYTEASLTYSLGYKNGPTITGPDGDPRGITVNTFADGLATGIGVANSYALVSALELLVAGPLADNLNIATGYDFGMADLRIAMSAVLL